MSLLQLAVCSPYSASFVFLVANSWHSWLSNIVGILQIILLAFLIGWVYTLKVELGEVNNRLTAAITPTVPTHPILVKLPPDAAAPTLGSVNAKVVMTVFSDFECGYCKVFAQTILPRLKDDYVKTGKLRIVFRDLPLEMHEKAFGAAEAAACANEQGQFWQMHDYLFGNQQSLNERAFRKWANASRMDTSRYGMCLQRHTYHQAIETDMQAAQAVGIQGTPAIVVNNKMTMGIRPYEYFARAIDKELATGQ